MTGPGIEPSSNAPGIGSASNNNPLTNLFNNPASNSGRGREDYFYPMAGINPFNPPEMKTLVYAPEVRILIARGHKQYDVSRDVVRGTIHRKENSASSLFFTLANNGDYNGLFHRMDRVVVFLKRIRWQQVFSGYLDSVPYAQLYGGPAEYRATCTIKRLMHTWWNPALPESAGILDQTLFAQGGDRDSGLGQVMRALMVRVGGWQPQDVLVQNFPMEFYEFLKSNVNTNRAANQAQADKFRQLLLGPNFNQSAPGVYAGWSNNAGSAGPPGAGEAFYIAQIVAACDSLGLGPIIQDLTNSQQIAQAAATGAEARDSNVSAAFTQAGQTAANWNQSVTNSDAAVLGVACAMAETGGGVTIRNLSNPGVADSLRFANDGPGQDHDSIGIFQQRGNGAWGTTSQRMDPRQAATMFFRALPPDWRNMDPGQAIHQTQRNATGASPYSAAYPLALQKITAYRAAMRGAQTTMAATPLGSAASAIGDTIGVNPIQVATAATATPATPGSLNSLRGKPNPDSEGAVQTALLAMNAPYAWGGKGPNAFDCVYGNDLVSTARGEVPIKDVTTDDWVWTRKGYRRVLQSWMVGEAEVISVKINGRILTATPDHRVWTDNRGWVPLGGLNEFDMIMTCHTRKSANPVKDVVMNFLDGPTGIIAAKPAAASAQPIKPEEKTREARRIEFIFRGWLTTDTPSRSALAIKTTSSAPENHCMWLSGNTTTALFSQATKSITSITTPSITTHQIWDASLSRNIAGKVRSPEKYTTTPVRGARKVSGPLPTPASGDFAQGDAVSGTAVIERKKVPVYDLMVEDEHEFFANGVLVHNCSGLMTWAYRGIGKNIGDGTSGISASTPRIDPSQVARGDIIITNGGGHVGMYYEPGLWIDTGGPEGAPGGINPLPPPSEWVSVHRVAQNGGPDPAAPRQPPLTAGPGTPAGTGDQYTSGTGGGAASEGIARNLFAYAFSPERFASPLADIFRADHKEFMACEPLIQIVQSVARAGLRNFASAPDGSFMAYYPDYFGLSGKKAVVQLEDIELKNVKIDYSDDSLTTHVYVAGSTFTPTESRDPSIVEWLESAGSVTVEHEWLYRRLTQIAPGDLSGADATEIMRRFGVRPLKMPVAMAAKKELEFLLACQVFMEKWAEQYRTTVEFTFLPELYPGMRVILSGHDLQVYVTSVTHTFDFEGGFHTQAEIMAPSRPDAANLMIGQGGVLGPDDTSVLSGLGFNPDGTTSTQVMPNF